MVVVKVCYARVLDYRRKFIEAAQRYNELSYRGIIHEDERMTALRNALICTILASAGQQRSRMLATLFKDERCQQLQAYSILEKMYLDRIIRRRELVQLDSLLQPHQKASTADGTVPYTTPLHLPTLLPSFTGFHWVLPSFTGFCLVLPGFC